MISEHWLIDGETREELREKYQKRAKKKKSERRRNIIFNRE